MGMFAEIKTRICVSSTTVHVDTDDACAITVVVTRVRRMREGAATRLRTRLRKDGQTNAGRKGGRERRWRSREGARERERESAVGGKDSCHCQWVIRSMGQWDDHFQFQSF